MATDPASESSTSGVEAAVAALGAAMCGLGLPILSAYAVMPSDTESPIPLAVFGVVHAAMLVAGVLLFRSDRRPVGVGIFLGMLFSVAGWLSILAWLIHELS